MGWDGWRMWGRICGRWRLKDGDRKQSIEEKMDVGDSGGQGCQRATETKNNRTYCSWSQWPRGLRRGSAAARLTGLWVRIPPGAWMFFSCVCCVLSSWGLCDGLITHPEESYRVWCVWVWPSSLETEGALAHCRMLRLKNSPYCMEVAWCQVFAGKYQREAEPAVYVSQWLLRGFCVAMEILLVGLLSFVAYFTALLAGNTIQWRVMEWSMKVGDFGRRWSCFIGLALSHLAW